jgi:hypothetical protein
MRGVRVPAGRHSVTFVYRPHGLPLALNVGACATILAWAAARSGLAARERRRRKALAG